MTESISLQNKAAKFFADSSPVFRAFPIEPKSTVAPKRNSLKQRDIAGVNDKQGLK